MRVIWFIVELNRINYSLRTSSDVTLPENNVTFMRSYRWYFENILVAHFISSCKSYVTKFVWQGRCHLCNFEYRNCSNAVYNAAVIANEETSFAIVKCVRLSSQDIFLWPMERYKSEISDNFRIFSNWLRFICSEPGTFSRTRSEGLAERVLERILERVWNAFYNAFRTRSATRPESVLERIQNAFLIRLLQNSTVPES
jgi:hypothetical protein